MDGRRGERARPGAEASGVHHLGLDLGGTNLKWAVVERRDKRPGSPAGGDDSSDGDDARPAAGGPEWRIVGTGQVPTAVGGGPEAIVGQLVDLACAAGRDHAATSVGIGVPGLYDPELGTIVFLPNVPGDWAGRAVAAPVSDACGLPTFLVNDARAFGLAELRLGAGRGASSLVGLTLGTGVGGAIAVDGRIIQGRSGTAGEIGHQTIDPDGPLCGCGNRGCLEAYARADQIALRCGAPTVEEAVARASAGDERCLRGLAEVGRYLGIGIANVITLVTPDVVVLGGGVARAGELLLASLRAELRERVRVTDLAAVRVLPAELGVWAGAVGAAVHGAERTAEAGGVEGRPKGTAGQRHSEAVGAPRSALQTTATT